MDTDTRQSDEDHRRFARFRPPQAGEGGTMSLLDHIRELRYRIIVSFIAVVITSSVAFVFYRPLVEIVMHPYQQASLAIKAKNPTASLQVVNTGVVAPFVLNMRVAIVAGLIAACPIWLYQVWAFIVPGLLVNEKKWALRFLGSAIPLFLLGSVLGYWVLPKGIALMLNFTPHGMGITNLLDMNAFLALEIRVILLFGVSFLLPVVLVLLNLIHVLSSAQLKAARKWSIFGFFCLGAFVNPSGDPISMCALAIPLSVMYVIAEWICRSNERKRSTNNMGIDKSEFDIQID